MEAPRPGMRRKSSASNLLSSFQGSRGAASQAGNTNMNGTSLKEYESNSSFSDAASLATTTPGNSLTVPSSSTESVRETINRRLLAIAHVRQSYEGKQHWLNTVLVDQFELEKTYSNVSMRKRTWKFAVLGMSLSSVFESKGIDVLKALTLILNEYDQLPDQPPDEIVRPKMRSLLRGKQQARKGGGGSGFDTDIEPGLAIGINIPFPLDYIQTLITFLDILTEVYIKLRNIISTTTPLLHSGMSHSVPPGAGYSIAPQTPNHSNNYIYSQLFTNDHTAARPIPDSPGGPQAAAAGVAGAFVAGAIVGTTGSTIGSATTETILKLDGRFKKIINNLLKELDAMARESIKEELSSLNPLLRNLGLHTASEGGFDFDG